MIASSHRRGICFVSRYFDAAQQSARGVRSDSRFPLFLKAPYLRAALSENRFRLSLKRFLARCLVGKPVPTFPEALYYPPIRIAPGHSMQQYHDLLRLVLETGTDRDDRTGTGTRSVFGHQMRFDLGAGFPVLTTKKLHLRSIIIELLWFLKGDTNIAWLKENGVSIWDDWADEKGDLGPVYGYQWRSWPGPDGKSIDQISEVMHAIRTNPTSRRLIVSAWNPALVEEMALPPCHCLFQFYVDDGRLSCQLYQRSADIFLGVPFNIASYALLTMMMAQVTGLKPGEFIHTLGDAHLYSNHREQAEEQLQRALRPLPQMRINPDVGDIFAFGLDDFTLENYDPHPHIAAKVAV